MIRKDTAKTFMFVCFGLVALAGAVQLVAPDAVAQSAEPTTVAAAYTHGGVTYYHYAIMTNGDVYRSEGDGSYWTFKANVFTAAGVVPLSGASMGEVKRVFGK
jgi:hypothetical protein